MYRKKRGIKGYLVISPGIPSVYALYEKVEERSKCP